MQKQSLLCGNANAAVRQQVPRLHLPIEIDQGRGGAF
jgi:hypothetical protein